MTADPRRSRIMKGMFLTSDPCPPGYVPKRRLSFDLDDIKAQHATAVAELTRRLEAVRVELDRVKRLTK